jgi:hypothetical protein
MENNQPKKRNRTGQRGIKNVDPVQDNVLFIDAFEEDGKHVRLGKYRISHEITNRLAVIALELKTSRSALIREILIDFIKFYDESKLIGGERFFEASKTIHEWVQQRNDFALLLKSIISKDHIMDLESKSPESKMISQQLVVIAKMLNLTNKNVL